MRISKLKIQPKSQIMIIPMIDIIFFLLVFFMMSTLYMVQQQTHSVALPQSSTAKSSQAACVPITVTIRGTVFFNKEEIPSELLATRIQAELLRDANTSFMLRGDRQVEYGKVIALLDELKKAGVKKITVATELKR